MTGLEAVTVLIEILHGLHGLRELIQSIRAVPSEILIILSITLIAGALAAILIRQTRSNDSPPTLR